jgi:hypothetical protein
MTRAPLVALAVLSLVSSVSAADGEAAYDAVPAADHEWYVSAYRSAVARAAAGVTASKRLVRTARGGKAKQAAQARLRAYEAEAESLKRNDPPFVPRLTSAEDLKTGRYLRVSVQEWNGLHAVMVEQVLEDGKAIVVPTFAYQSGVSRATGRPIPQLDTRRGKPLILVGIDTTDLTDGVPLKSIDTPFRVTGTETYETVNGGTNTVFRLERVEPADIFKRPAKK